MALIHRLNTPSDSESVMGRVLAMRRSREAVAPEKTPSEHPASDAPRTESTIDAAAAIRSLLRELQTQRRYGIATPSHLFSMLHSHLRMERGALLVPNQEDEFLPIATSGLDRTSRFRLRVTGAELSELLTPGSVTVLSGAARDFFSDRLSRVDFRSSPRLGLFPFTHLSRVLALLVVFDSPILESERVVLDVLLAALSDNAGRLIFDGRHKPLGFRNRGVVLPTDQISTIRRRVAETARELESVAEVIEVEFDSTIRTILEAHPHLDRERLVEDVFDTAALLVSTHYSVVRSDNDRMLLFGVASASVDVELLIHLLGSTLAQLFGCDHLPKLQFHLRSADDIGRDA
ncbi:MAG: hypothetical protein MI724_03750 [Spirochaetales bacterium]|nr:hypothetical protein [Spirochaetales bacterium]